ncbi:DNA recombination protein RmuC [Cryomorpha ignava]|uniref:DNA recombination protein RmuC n=1 Tax=Cryomorpha ignava TaxID=101383 RepID=A0A7K3WS07_9FLAO|nr:DNA recombination protein RmuC [Cryomorpha ignava]NEN23485.1 DNA recombination protein RmuC [Cryomorpha ignava]
MDTAIYFALFFCAGAIFGFILLYLGNRSKTASANKVEEERNALQSHVSGLTQKAEILGNSLNELKTKNQELELTNNQNQANLARLGAEKAGLEQHIARHKEDLVMMREQFTKDFQILANKIFEEKSEKFTLQNRSNLDQILNPLKEKIADFQKKVEETHTSNIKESTGLREELKHLKDMSQRMTNEAENLTRALKNDSKVQGNWGEMILESILEKSGLARDREYFIQQSFTNEDGRRLQPDVLIKLPEDKWIVVDSKVSLKAYEQYAADDIETESQAHLRDHLLSVKTHIRSLADKKYQELGSGKNLDFILMFIPIEPAYLLALQKDHSLFQEAYDRNIILVSPTTLIASLKIISSTWKHEFQNRNAMEIADRGKKLLEKFIGFAEDFEKIGEHLNRTEKTYSDAMNKLRDGRGSLVSQAKQLEELGVKTNKQFSENLLAGEE